MLWGSLDQAEHSLRAAGRPQGGSPAGDRHPIPTPASWKAIAVDALRDTLLWVTAAGFFPHHSLPQNMARSEELLLKPSGLEGHEHHAVHAQLKQSRGLP